MRRVWSPSPNERGATGARSTKSQRMYQQGGHYIQVISAEPASSAREQLYRIVASTRVVVVDGEPADTSVLTSPAAVGGSTEQGLRDLIENRCVGLLEGQMMEGQRSVTSLLLPTGTPFPCSRLARGESEAASPPSLPRADSSSKAGGRSTSSRGGSKAATRRRVAKEAESDEEEEGLADSTNSKFGLLSLLDEDS